MTKLTLFTTCDGIYIKSNRIYLSNVFTRQEVGLNQVDDKIWLVSLIDYDLGYFDIDSKNFEA